jgi:hypothetical protein
LFLVGSMSNRCLVASILREFWVHEPVIETGCANKAKEAIMLRYDTVHVSLLVVYMPYIHKCMYVCVCIHTLCVCACYVFVVCVYMRLER